MTAMPITLLERPPLNEDETEVQTDIEFFTDADVLAEGSKCSCQADDDNPH